MRLLIFILLFSHTSNYELRDELRGALSFPSWWQCGADMDSRSLGYAAAWRLCRTNLLRFNRCCKDHDVCYDKQIVGGQKACDNKFGHCLIDGSGGVCRQMARIFWVIVSVVRWKYNQSASYQFNFWDEYLPG